MNLLELVTILFVHYFIDYGLQAWAGWGARKHRDVGALLWHVWSYLVALLLVGHLLVGPNEHVAMWALLNSVAHLAVDGVTSRVTHRLHETGRTRAFWNVHGLDQFLHVPLLLGSWMVMVS